MNLDIDPETMNARVTKMMDDIRKEVYSKPPLIRDDGVYDRPPLPPLSEFYAMPLSFYKKTKEED